MTERRTPLPGALAILLVTLGCSSQAAGPCCGGARAGDPGPTPATASSPTSAGALSYCAACQARVSVGALQSAEIRETSGIAAGALHPELFYVHNDSGDAARFFAVDEKGQDQGTFDLAGVSASDWEDVARGPCTTAPVAGSCLYFADTGDNKGKRGAYVIYRVPEPSAVGPGQHTVTAQALPFVYPDGSHNAETILVHPKTGVITLVTKVKKKGGGTASLYELPLPLTPDRPATLIKVGEITPPGESQRLTGGAVHPEGLGVLLRNHTSVLHYAMRPEQTVAEALAGVPCVFAADATKGEAVTWLPRGDGFVTVSEGVGAAISLTRCPGAR